MMIARHLVKAFREIEVQDHADMQKGRRGVVLVAIGV